MLGWMVAFMNYLPEIDGGTTPARQRNRGIKKRDLILAWQSGCPPS